MHFQKIEVGKIGKGALWGRVGGVQLLDPWSLRCRMPPLSTYTQPS